MIFKIILFYSKNIFIYSKNDTIINFSFSFLQIEIFNSAIEINMQF